MKAGEKAGKLADYSTDLYHMKIWLQANYDDISELVSSIKKVETALKELYKYKNLSADDLCPDCGFLRDEDGKCLC